MPKIQLVSSDNESFEVDVEVVNCSSVLQTMLELCKLENSENVVVPLPEVSSQILFKILIWAKYHKDDPQQVEGAENISAWDADFMRVHQSSCFELMKAANYLDIKGLLDLTSNFIADMIKGKTPEAIRETFNIRNDFLPTEEN